MTNSAKRTASHCICINSEFWKLRAKDYNKLEWATRSDYLKWFLARGGFQPNNVVLDVGAGTGVVAHAVTSLVRHLLSSPERAGAMAERGHILVTQLW